MLTIRIGLCLTLLCCTCLPLSANAKEVYPDRQLTEIYVQSVDGNRVRFASNGAAPVVAQLGDTVGTEGMIVTKIESYVVTVMSPAGDRAARLAVGGGVGGFAR